jgi:acylphosphatase
MTTAMTQTEPLARRVIVEGLVQGVGYRHFAQRAALRLGLSGWVRNRADGAVEALISGTPDAVEAMLAELRRGPQWAEVRSVRLAEADGAEWTPGVFAVRPTA